MEKIQSAIEKARAARVLSGADALIAPEIAAAASSGATPDQTVAAAWSDLQPYGEDNPARLRRNRIVSLTRGKDTVPFDMMRTKVLQQMRANGWKRLAITSPTPSCGKSTIALNLAFSLTRQAELRVILGELDLHHPSLAKMLGITGRHGFAAVLEGQNSFASVALRHGAGLALAVNDGAVRNPSELLQSSSVAPALAALEAIYAPDIMLFDMPPMLVSDDVMAFMGHVDAVLLIAAAETTTTKEIDTCERELAAQTNVMGVVLNKCHFMGKDYGYSYYS